MITKKEMKYWTAGIFLIVGVAAVSNAAEYYVSPQGKDTAPGSKSAPWQTLARACKTVAPGDTLILRYGTYRETLRPQCSGEKGRPVRFQSFSGERAVISGAELLTGEWQNHGGKIYKIRSEFIFEQLFVDGKMMAEARWPNSPFDNLMEYNRAVTEEGTGYETLVDSHLPAGDWTGGVVLMWPGQWWVSNTRRIASYQAGKSLRFSRTTEPKRKDQYHANDPYQPRAGNHYVIMGALAGLDAPGEWFLDRDKKIVYLWLPEGDDPGQHCVEVKQRNCAVNLSKLGFIEIKGVDVFGAGVNMSDTHDSLLENCNMRYVEHFRDCERDKHPSVQNVISGKNNTWRRCLVAYAATTLLSVRGENNRLDNCVMHDGNYLGTGRGGLDLGRSVAAHVSHCTLFRSGRDLVGHGRSRKLRFEYNDLSAANMLNNDAAAIYCWGTDGERGVIAYNWIHDNIRSRGVYLDNFSTNFVVHHNVIWGCAGNAIRMNCDAVNHQVYNNTMMQVDEPFGTYTYAGYEPTMQGTKVINNLVNVSMDSKDPRQFVQGELGPEMHHNSSGAVDRDGYPVAGSKAIDAGVVIPGITDGFKGKAPDLGAYEFGGARWTAGADWKDADAIFVSNKNLAYKPQPPVTAENMITKGLILWLDATDSDSLELKPDGSVVAWRDKSQAAYVAKPKNSNLKLQRVADGLNGKAVVRGNGREKLYISGMPQRGPGGVTALVVSQSKVTTGPTWGRIIQCFTGEGKSWEHPNWEIMHPGGKTPLVYDAKIFLHTRQFDASLADITMFGTAADVAEVLVFDRTLRFDEQEALQNYLRDKWGLKGNDK
jgi:hypothetical protein